MPNSTLYLATGVFVLTYVLISIRSIRNYRIDRPAVALFGAALMIGFGIVSPAQALEAVNLDVIFLLLGMMLIVAGLDVCGFFDIVSLRIVEMARNQIHFLALLLLSTAFLSALVLNDTIVLLMTPIVVKSCRTMRINAVPFLVGEAFAANIGSVATEVGNPQNAYIAIQSRIPFVDFTATLFPIALISLGVAFIVLLIVFRHDLSSKIEDSSEVRRATPIMIQKRGLVLVLIIVNWAVLSFFLSPPTMLPFIALIGGSVVLLALPAVARTTPRSLFEKVDWSIIIFFIGLFIVLKGVETSGLLAEIVTAFSSVGGNGGIWWLSGLSALLSNLISNVPAVILLAPVVAASPMSLQRSYWLALAASSTLAGNATILGAAANIIVVQVASRAGAEVSMKDFVKAGVPVTLVTLALATILLAL